MGGPRRGDGCVCESEVDGRGEDEAVSADTRASEGPEAIDGRCDEANDERPAAKKSFTSSSSV